MKIYKKLILSYIDKYHEIDYQLLKMEFGVQIKQIVAWLEQLKDDGYIIWKDRRFYLTDLGEVEKPKIWNEFSRYISKEKPGTVFDWDFLYIPSNFSEL